MMNPEFDIEEGGSISNPIVAQNDIQVAIVEPENDISTAIIVVPANALLVLPAVDEHPILDALFDIGFDTCKCLMTSIFIFGLCILILYTSTL